MEFLDKAYKDFENIKDADPEVFESISKDILEHFNSGESQSYEAVKQPYLQKNLNIESGGKFKLSNIESPIQSIKDYSEETKKFLVQWRDTWEFPSSVGNCDWCFIMSGLIANGIKDHKTLQAAYKSWLQARKTTGIDKKIGFNYAYPSNYQGGFRESILRVKNFDPRMIPQNGIPVFLKEHRRLRQKLRTTKKLNPKQYKKYAEQERQIRGMMDTCWDYTNKKEKEERATRFKF